MKQTKKIIQNIFFKTDSGKQRYKNVRYAALLLILTLCIGAFAGCFGGGKQGENTDTQGDSQSSSDVLSDTETKPVTETDAQTEETETDAQSTDAQTTDAVTEKPETAAPQIVSDNGKDALSIAKKPAGTYINPLTGLSCSKEQAERRPVAIMLNNIAQALPQQQISYADVLYECQVEGGLTRLLGVFNDWSSLTAIGSIRSSREYYIDFAANHDAIYVHAGGSESAYVNLKSRKTNNIDAVNDGNVSAFFYRDPVRRQTMSYEHTLVIDGDDLDAAIAKKKYRTDYASSFTNPLNFVGENQVISLSKGAKATSATVKFGAHTTSYTYDADKNVYLRFQNGNKHIDGTTGTQLAFENVIILFCPYTFTKDDYNHIEVSDVGSGKGYYLTGGKYMEIQYSKASGDTPFKLTYPGGRAVYLTPGKTNIEIVNTAGNVAISG